MSIRTTYAATHFNRHTAAATRRRRRSCESIMTSVRHWTENARLSSWYLICQAHSIQSTASSWWLDWNTHLASQTRRLRGCGRTSANAIRESPWTVPCRLIAPWNVASHNGQCLVQYCTIYIQNRSAILLLGTKCNIIVMRMTHRFIRR